jgi:hypothetical protein
MRMMNPSWATRGNAAHLLADVEMKSRDRRPQNIARACGAMMLDISA